MKGKKLILLAMAIALLVAIPALVFAGPGEKGKAELRPPTKLGATIKFQDDGTDLTIQGTATGLKSGRSSGQSHLIGITL